MKIITDLHLHSKYSRAVSPKMTISEIAMWAKVKGIDLVSTSDFFHPKWREEVKESLEEDGSGFLRIKNNQIASSRQKSGLAMTGDLQFLLSTEISSIYKQNGKLRRIHNLIFLPSIRDVEKLEKEFLKRGANLKSDGRPIVGFTARDIAEVALGVCEKALIIPAHVWTPHFGLYGSKSGFDTIAECYGDMAQFIYGIETGISSDPAMNWRISDLDNRSILSFSDAHSGPKIGREVTVFQTEFSNSNFQFSNKKDNFSYDDLYRAIGQDKNSEWKVESTVEFFPEEGLYHYSGHRNCNFKTSGTEEICPICHKPLTEGVMHRVEMLAKISEEKLRITKTENRNGVLEIKSGLFPNRPGFIRMIPLNEILGEVFAVGVGSKKVVSEYVRITTDFASEFDTLLNKPLDEIVAFGGEKLGEAIGKVRKQEVLVDPGYDGVYGEIKLEIRNERKKGRAGRICEK